MIDAGDFFGPKAPPRERDKSKLVAGIMAHAGYDVVGVGEAELRYGLGFLRAQVETNNLPMVSANLVYADSEEPVFSPFQIIKRGGLKIAVTGLTGEWESLRGKEDLRAWRDQNIVLADPKVALEQVIAKMKKEKADFVVVVSHVGTEVAYQLAEQIPGITLWIEAHNRGRMVTPEKKGETIFAACRGRSSSYSELYLSVDPESLMVSNFVGQARTLPSKGASDEAVVAMIGEFKKSQQAPVQQRQRQARQTRIDPKMAAKETYFGVESCKKCHAEAFETWTLTPHASAYATIAETDQWNDPDCLLCHTTGYGEMSDVESGMIEPKYWNVQCESCHGMGTHHSRAPAAAKVSEHMCTECHNQSNSPEFEYEEYLQHVLH